MSVYVIGVAMHAPKLREDALRLEEVAYYTSRASLDSAGVSRRQIDSITLGACDELDGRPISSMLMTAPAGGYHTDEIKVTDSGASALCLAYARFMAGESQLGLVVSWCKCSKTDVDAVMRLRGEPFYTRPLGIDGTVSDAMFAQAVTAEFALGEEEIIGRVIDAYTRAANNDRGMRHPIPSPDSIRNSAYDALPLRTAVRAPLTDGAVALVLASDDFLNVHRDCKPLARIASAAWATDSYRLGAERLRALRSARTAWSTALRQAGCRDAADIDVIEVESPTPFHEAAYTRAFGIDNPQALSPSGGAYAQNPLFCTGLVNAAEAVLQVSGKAASVQRKGARWAAAHSCHGYAQQGNVVMVFEGDEAAR
jgi:acetyl-CoA acetyltransferase